MSGVEEYLAVGDGARQTRMLCDFEECKRGVREVIESAEETLDYSTFICDPEVRLPSWDGREEKTFGTLIQEACGRGVEVTIAYNPASCYGNLSEAEFVAAVAPARVVSIRGSLGPAPWMLYFSNNASWSYHHQKYAVADGGAKIMVTGCDLNGERAGWLELNAVGYYWHELGALMELSPGPERDAVGAWVRANTLGGVDTAPEAIPPPPLVQHASEADIMRTLIAESKTSIHLENQSFMSGWGSKNGIAGAIVDRVVRAVAEGQIGFRVLILTNMAQQDEPSFMTRLYCSASLLWSIRYMERMAGAAGVSLSQFYDHVFIGYMEHEGVLVKVHSNILIVDSSVAIRSSSNLSDRCLSEFPTDSELGLLVTQGVAEFESRLFSMYLGVEGTTVSVSTAFAAAKQGHGVFRSVDQSLRRTPDVLNDALVSFLQSTPATGGQEPTFFTATPGGAGVPVAEPKSVPVVWMAVAVVIVVVALLMMMLP